MNWKIECLLKILAKNTNRTYNIPTDKITEKAIWNIIWHCILNAISTKTLSSSDIFSFLVDWDTSLKMD